MVDYDAIGIGYPSYRQPDPRIRAEIEAALGDARTVLDVGSGTGSYEPRRRLPTAGGGTTVVAVEPSRTMIGQRPAGAAPVVQAVAEHLPFPDHRFDAGLAVLTVHHWTDHVAGLRELARVTGSQVVLTWEPQLYQRFWLVAEYLPEMALVERDLATLDAVADVLAVTSVRPVPVPADCTDGFSGAYWRRPDRYLDPGVRRAISTFARCDPGHVATAMARLEDDLASGAWARRHGRLLALDALDLGYRLVLAAGLRRPEGDAAGQARGRPA